MTHPIEAPRDELNVKRIGARDHVDEDRMGARA